MPCAAEDGTSRSGYLIPGISKMLRWIILAAIVVGLTAMATLLIAILPEPDAGPKGPVTDRSRAGPPGKAELVGNLVYDFGTMPKQSEGTHTWQVKNLGQGILDVWIDGWQCSCTVAKLGGKSIKKGEEKTVVQKVKPGESTPVDVTWQTKNWNKFGQSVTIGTNDPSHPTFALTITGKVVPPVMVFPSETVTFPGISNEEAHRATV